MSSTSVFSTVINFGMLGILCRLHRLHIQLALQVETKEEIVFPRMLKHAQKLGKNNVKHYKLADVTDDKIHETIKRAQAKAKVIVEELGMAKTFAKHLFWGPKIKIIGIDGGVEDITELLDDDYNDASDEEEVNNDTIGEEQPEQDHITQIQESCTEDECMIASDLENISKHNLIDSNVVEKLKAKINVKFTRSCHQRPFHYTSKQKRKARKPGRDMKTNLVHL